MLPGRAQACLGAGGPAGLVPGGQEITLQAPPGTLSAATCRLGAAHPTTPHWLLGSKPPPGSKGWCGIKQMLEMMSGLALSTSLSSIALGCSGQGGRRRGTQRGREAGAVGGRD